MNIVRVNESILDHENQLLAEVVVDVDGKDPMGFVKHLRYEFNLDLQRAKVVYDDLKSRGMIELQPEEGG